MQSADMPGWVFDVGYFRKRPFSEKWEGEAVQFRIINGNDEKFLTLYNHHNGYYSRGFDFTCPIDPSKNREGIV